MTAITTTGSGNWSSTTADAPWPGGTVPVEGDTVIIANTHTVTIDQNITIGADSATAAINIAAGGKLELLYTAAADYTLTLKGNLAINGTLEIGTVANPIPTARLFTIKTNYSATLAVGKYGILINDGSTCTIQGVSMSYDRALLAANVVVNGTSLTTDVSTGWVSGDVIAVASTSRTYTECENGDLNGAASGTTLTVHGFGGAGGGVAYAHSGTSPTQAEIINLTRNILITAYNTSYNGYIVINTTAVIDIDWTEFSYLGSATVDKYGIVAKTTTGSVNIQRCSIHNIYSPLYISGTTTNNITFSNNVCYKASYHMIYYTNQTSGTSLTFNNNVLMYTTASNTYGIYSRGIVGSYTNNTIVGAYTFGVYLGGFTGDTFSGNTIHSCGSSGVYASTSIITTSSTIVWRNALFGMEFNMNYCREIIVDTATFFGNNLASIKFTNTGFSKLIVLNNITSNGDSTFATTDGLRVNAPYVDISMNNCNFSTASGIKTAHTNDIDIYDANTSCEIILRNCKLSASTEILNLSYMYTGSYIKSAKHGQQAGNHKSWFKYGTITIDTTAGMFHTASPSERLTPNNATNKLESGPKRVAVANAGTVTPSVWVRESVVGDGTDYNGNRIRLIVKKNVAAGIAADAVLATATVSSEGAFQQISGTTAAVTDDAVLEFVVDCDGTTGWVNVDDWTATVA